MFFTIYEIFTVVKIYVNNIYYFVHIINVIENLKNIKGKNCFTWSHFLAGISVELN